MPEPDQGPCWVGFLCKISSHLHGMGQSEWACGHHRVGRARRYGLQNEDNEDPLKRTDMIRFAF